MTLVGPYLELMRFGNPIGAVMVYFPYLHGSLVALSKLNTDNDGDFVGFLETNMILLAMAVMEHSMACSWNDIVDSEIDKNVVRTRLRPIPRGAISLRNAYVFTFVEGVIWLALCRLNSVQTLLMCLPLLPMTILYPYSKRFTHYTTLFLSPIIAWAVYVGSVSTGADPFGSSSIFWGLTCMFFAEGVHHNTVEMIYAHQDLQDDLKAGINSMAIRFRSGPKVALTLFALTELAFRVAAGAIMEFGTFYYILACIGTAAMNVWMIVTVDLADSKSCWWWFQGGGFMTGSIISVGLLSQL